MIPLRLDISVIGTQNVRRALTSIERDIVRSNARMARASGVSTSKAAKGSTSTAKVSAEQKRLHAERMAQIKAEQSLDKQRSRALFQQYQREQREIARLERASIAKERRIQQEKLRTAKITQREQTKQARAQLQARQRFARGVGFTAGQSIVRGTAAVGRAGLTAATIGGGLLLHSALSTQLEETKLAGRLAAQSGQVGEKGALLKEARGVKGFTGAEALQGMTSFFDITGELGVARDILQEMGQTALATNTDLTDLGSAAGSAFIALGDKIQDPQKRLMALKNVMRQMAGAGQIGAVEVKDLAKEMAGLAGTSQFFAGDAEENLKTMVAMAQLSRQRGGSSSAAESVMATKRMATDLLNPTKQRRLKKAGINIFSDKSKTELKAMPEIIADILEKTGGDLSKAIPMLNMRSLRAFMGVERPFIEAEKKKKGSGRAAVMAEFDKFLSAQLSDEDVAKRRQSRLEDPDIVFKEAMKDFNHAVGNELLPAVTKLVPKFVELIPSIVNLTDAFGRFIEYAAENPWKGLGAIIGVAIAKEIAMAGIGKIVGAAFSGMMMQTRLGTGAAGAVGALGGVGGVGNAAGGLGGVGGVAGRGAGFFGMRGVGMMGKLGAGLGILGAAGMAAGAVALAVDQYQQAEEEGVFDFLTGADDRRAKEEATKRYARRRDTAREKATNAKFLGSDSGFMLEEAFKTGPTVPENALPTGHVDLERQLRLGQMPDQLAGAIPSIEGVEGLTPGAIPGMNISLETEKASQAMAQGGEEVKQKLLFGADAIEKAAMQLQIIANGNTLNRGNSPSAVKP